MTKRRLSFQAEEIIEDKTVEEANKIDEKVGEEEEFRLAVVAEENFYCIAGHTLCSLNGIFLVVRQWRDDD